MGVRKRRITFEVWWGILDPSSMDWLKGKKHEPLQKIRHPNHFDGNLGEDSVRMSPQSQPMFMVPACSHGHLSCKATTIAKCHKIDRIWSPFQTRKLVPWSGRSLSMTLNAHLPEALARQLGSETIALIGHQGDPKVLVNFGKSLEGLTCGLHFIDFHRGYWAYWGLAPQKKLDVPHHASPSSPGQQLRHAKTASCLVVLIALTALKHRNVTMSIGIIHEDLSFRRPTKKS